MINQCKCCYDCANPIVTVRDESVSVAVPMFTKPEIQSSSFGRSLPRRVSGSKRPEEQPLGTRLPEEDV